MDEIKYPIGAFELPKEITQKHITTYISLFVRGSSKAMSAEYTQPYL